MQVHSAQNTYRRISAASNTGHFLVGLFQRTRIFFCACIHCMCIDVKIRKHVDCLKIELVSEYTTGMAMVRASWQDHERDFEATGFRRSFQE